jgi:protein SCO1/2
LKQPHYFLPFWACLGLLGAACVGLGSFRGTPINSSIAPDFRLTAEDGTPFALSEDRGKVVILTFLYTHCTDVCPIISDKLSMALDDLGPNSSRVAVVVVSVDPQGDTPQSVEQFAITHHMFGRWTYLIGDEGQLQVVWKEYGIAVTPVSSAGGEIDHSTRVLIIDPEGRERSNFDSDFAPQDLVHDVRLIEG